MVETVEETQVTPSQNGTPPSDTKGGRKSRGPSRSAKNNEDEATAKSEEKTENSEVVANGETAASSEDAGKEVAKGKKGKKNSSKKEKSAEVNGEDATVEKKIPKKKKIPQWATLSAKHSASLKPGQIESSKSGGQSSIDVIINAVEANANEKGFASLIVIKKHIAEEKPDWPRVTWKSALKKALAKGCIKQVRSSYKVMPEKSWKKEKEVKKEVKKTDAKKGKKKSSNLPPLEELFPHIFTWACDPKEASAILIKRYITQHFPNLSPEVKLKKAIESMTNRGLLEQITGSGGNQGTFQLKDGAKKSGNQYEDPIEDAIIASNSPKDCGIARLHRYLLDYHLEYDIDNNPQRLRAAILRAEEKGWIKRISGKGMSGKFRLAYEYIPSPKDLWRDDYNASDYDKTPKRKVKEEDSSDDEAEEESEEESEDDEPPPPKKSKAASARQSKKSAKKPAKKPAKTPAKKKSKFKVPSDDEEEEPEYTPKKKRGPPTKRGEPVAKKRPAPASKAKKSSTKKADTKAKKGTGRTSKRK